jgi:hypothetical protein
MVRIIEIIKKNNYSAVIVLLILFSNNVLVAQDTVRISAYNVFEYETGSTSRDSEYITVIDAFNPDILIAVEVKNDSAAEDFRTDVLNHAVTDKFLSGFSPPTSASGGYNNYVFYKPTEFTFLSGEMIVESGKWPTLEFQLYHNLTGDKIVIYGVHLQSGESPENREQRAVEARVIRDSSDALPSGTYFIAAGDFNLFRGGREDAVDTLIDSGSGKFIDPAGLPLVDWNTEEFAWFQTQATSAMDDRLDMIWISQIVEDAGGVQIIEGSADSLTVVQFGNDGKHFNIAIDSSPEIPEGQAMADALRAASDHLPVYADFTFDIPTAKNPPYQGSIVFTQVGADDNDVIEFMTLYRMDLTTLTITDNSITDSTGGPLTATEGMFDLSNTSWTNVPGGTYVRLGTDLTNDNTVGGGDRILQYNGTPGSAPYPSLDDGSGEQLIAYTGSSSNPNYIAGINWGNSGWLTKPMGSTSYAPGTLSDIQLGSLDNYYYSGSVDDILYVTRDSLTTSGNWSGSDTRIGYKSLGIGNSALPVELDFFTAILNGSQVELRWKTETEVNNYGFYIERSNDISDWTAIGFVEGHGNSNSPKQYNFNDNDINQTGTYYYRLKQIDFDGTIEYFNIVSVKIEIPNKYYLSQNFPNPFNPETRISFTLPEKQLVSLRVYNMLGELVEELVNGPREAGSYTITFDASNLSSGIYIYRIQTDNFAENKKMNFLK